MKILVTIYPFGEKGNEPQRLLNGFDISYNEQKRKYNSNELGVVLQKINPKIIIAGTEKYDAQTLDLCPNLKMISRAGVGIDSIDLNECDRRGIVVTYTPKAAIHAVAELTIGQMFNCLRHIQKVSGGWQRYIGKSIRNCVIGVFGYGNIGSELVDKLQSLQPKKILVNDLDNSKLQKLVGADIASKDEIIEQADIITFHIPLIEPKLNPGYDNTNFFSQNELSRLKPEAIIINTSRGGIINETDLCEWLKNNPKALAAIDVFCEEPYQGPFASLDNAYLTPHLGSCTDECRAIMEVEAVQEVLNFINKKTNLNRVV